eukprot:m.10049 g.10049  ORF g.10049 m.10049 type:complete len:345 (-) comp8087_c0_seq1:281-1315(-)
MAALLSPPGSMAQADSFARVTKLWDENSGAIVPMDLHTACSCGEYAYVKKLLAENADPHAKNMEEWTPLAYASYGGHVKVVNLLIEAGKVNVHTKTGRSNMTSLMWAAACNQEVVISILLKHGAILDDEDNLGQSSLMWSILTESKNALRLLLKSGANVEHKEKKYGRTPLHIAVAERNEAIVDLLLRKGVDIAAVDNDNNSALQLAQKRPACTALINLIEDAKRKKQNPNSKLVNVRSEAGLGLDDLAGLNIDDDTDRSGFIPSPSPTKTSSHSTTTQFASTEEFLTYLNLTKYISLFTNANISFEALVDMDEAQLRVLGLTLFGPRRKIFSAVQRWKEEHQS